MLPALALLIAAAPARAAEPADLIVHKARVVTVDARFRVSAFHTALRAVALSTYRLAMCSPRPSEVCCYWPSLARPGVHPHAPADESASNAVYNAAKNFPALGSTGREPDSTESRVAAGSRASNAEHASARHLAC